jgi:hypothetical protein
VASVTEPAAAQAARVRSAGGAKGNERLTAALSLVLLVLLAVEAVTTLDLSAYLAVHIFLGLVLLPAVSLKLASTSWRAARYYAGSAEYRALGPPQIVLRLLAPLLVVATVVLFGTGVAFLIAGASGGLLLTLHAGSFVVWGVIMLVHVPVYLRRAGRDGLADWQPRRALAGARVRRRLLVGGLVAGIALALGSYSVQSSWLAHHHHHHDHGESAAPIRHA